MFNTYVEQKRFHLVFAVFQSKEKWKNPIWNTFHDYFVDGGEYAHWKLTGWQSLGQSGSLVLG